MKLQKIYTILKNISSDELILSNIEREFFIYKHDVNLTITAIPTNQHCKVKIPENYKQLIDKFCEINDLSFQKSEILIKKFDVQYVGVALFQLSFLSIADRIILPTYSTLKDYEHKFYQIYHEQFNSNLLFDISHHLSVQKSSFKEFPQI